MTDSPVADRRAAKPSDNPQLASDRAPLWLVACVVVLFCAVLVLAGLVVSRLMTRDLVTARARDARVQVLESAVAERPNDQAARLQLAYVYQQNNLLKDALAEYKKVLSANPENVGALYNAGLIQLALGQDAAGERALSRALELSPNHELAAHALATRYVATGDFERASTVAVAAADAHPDNADLQYISGFALENTGRAKEAAARYRLALKLVPDRVDAKLALKRLGSGR